MSPTLRWVQHLDGSNTWIEPTFWLAACMWCTFKMIHQWMGIENYRLNRTLLKQHFKIPKPTLKWSIVCGSVDSDSIWQFQHTRIVAWSDNRSLCAHFYNDVGFVKFKKGMYNYCLLKVPVLKLNRGEKGAERGRRENLPNEYPYNVWNLRTGLTLSVRFIYVYMERRKRAILKVIVSFNL